MAIELLSDTTLRALKAGATEHKGKQRLDDGGGLVLLLAVKGGGRAWRFNYSFAGKRKMISLGKYPDTTLATAREKATIQCSDNELSVSVADKNFPIVLCAHHDDFSIRDSDQLVLVGSGYTTESDADAAGLRLQNALMVALARVRVGADFGHRAAKGMITHHGLNWVEE